MTNYVTPRKACELLSVTEKTLRNWETKGLIKSIRTPSNQRRYDLDSISDLSPTTEIKSLPLTAGDTEVWKAAVALGVVKFYFTAYNPFSEEEKVKIIDKMNKEFFDDEGWLTHPRFASNDFDKMLFRVKYFAESINSLLNQAEKYDTGFGDTELIKENEKSLVQEIALSRFIFAAYREMGGDPTEAIKSINCGEKYKQEWGFYG